MVEKTSPGLDTPRGRTGIRRLRSHEDDQHEEELEEDISRSHEDDQQVLVEKTSPGLDTPRGLSTLTAAPNSIDQMSQNERNNENLCSTTEQSKFVV